MLINGMLTGRLSELFWWRNSLPFSFFSCLCVAYSILAIMRGIEKLLPYAASTHAKFWGFDETGNDPRIDVGRIRNIYETQGYNGRLSIEYEGPDDENGILHSKKLIQQFFAVSE